ncbi:hypothetical protein [Paenibacillus sp. LHD-38]|uniref:hypothetical protein n=1 Tax=Paenibacillus sp. LHD-38 TaxID=3072143 RepID=UPI00280D9282|nr:hypothetical protein [Paenibacillus sp. LHD-38]MDQ8735408.1 hypothetical protein [Paenibacillus sp. LHD-38]
MLRPRVIPIVITAAISASVLFGGWAIYNQVAVAAPLEQVAKEITGVVSSDKPVMDNEQVTIPIELNEDANLRDVYERIQANGEDIFDDRQLTLKFKGKPNKQLEDLWYAAMFDIAEAMETKTYSNIPEAMNKAAKAYKDITISTEMDEKNVYITIKNPEAVKYVVLPRTSNELEAW